MIVLIKDFGSDYWLKNKIVDCGKSSDFEQIDFDIEDNPKNNPEINSENILDNVYDMAYDMAYDIKSTNKNVNMLKYKKLNNNHKQDKYNYNNDSTYNNRNSKYIKRNTRTETTYNTDNENRLQYNRFKIKDIGINDLQKTNKYNSIYKNINSNNNQRQMYNVSPNCKLYDNKFRERKNVLDSFSKPDLICYKN